MTSSPRAAARSLNVLPTFLGLMALALATLLPLIFEQLPVHFLTPPAVVQWFNKCLVLLCLGAILACRWGFDRLGGRADGRLTLILVAAAGIMTACHWFMIDSQPIPAAWQPELYLGLLNHTCTPPHLYRPLPYGFVPLLEWVTHDWVFSCLAYRWFFNYWLLWAWFRFACLFHSPGRAVLTLLPFALLYPCRLRSIAVSLPIRSAIPCSSSV